MGITNKQLYDAIFPMHGMLSALQQSTQDIVKRLDKQNGSITSHAEAIALAQSDIRLIKERVKQDQSHHKTVSSRGWSMLTLLFGVGMAILQWYVIQTLTDLKASTSAEHSEIVQLEVTLTPTQHIHNQTPYAKPTPTATVEPMAHTRKISDQEITYLAALCFVEVRGMGSMSASACASVIDTVFVRMAAHTFSDGSIAGTLTFDCNQEDTECHFPAYVVNGCSAYSNCPYKDQDSLDIYRSIVNAYLNGDLRPLCAGFMYYGMKPFDDEECKIVDINSGQFINFHN